MTRHQSPPAGGANRFYTTRWSAVLLSAQSQATGCQEAFAELCRLYWYPLYGFRRRGYSAEDAQDLAQGFFLHLIERTTLKRVDRSKGKFRSFLLASLKNYLSIEAKRAQCLKRGGGTEIVHLDIEGAEERCSLEPVETLTPEKVFDARWAMALLGKATQYTAFVWEKISRTIPDSAEVEAELDELYEALLAAEGRITP